MPVTADEIARAKQVDIVALVRLSGLTPVPRGRQMFTTKEHTSLMLWVNERRWWSFAQGVGGDTIEWVRHQLNLSFEEAVCWLLNQPTERLPVAALKSLSTPPPPPLDRNLGQRFHQQLSPLDREWWLERGVPIKEQDQFLLGVHRHASYGLCYTIPIFENYQLVNIRLRLAQPKDPKDRYRPYDAGRGTHLFGGDLLGLHASPSVVIVAGEIKAVVLWANAIPAVSPTAGCGHWRPEWTAKLRDVKRVYVAFDPGEEAAGARVAEAIGAKARLVLLSAKPDDLINEKGVQAFRYHLKNALAVSEWRKAQTVELPESVTDALHAGPETLPPGESSRLPWQGELL